MRASFDFLFLVFLLMANGIPFVLAGSANFDQSFYKGNEAYEKGEYESALSIYEKLLQQEPASGELHYNMGNIAFRLNKIGKAVYHFRKAKGLLPRNADVKFNLDYARKRTVDNIRSEKAAWSPQSVMAYLPLNFKEGLYLLFITGTLFWGFSALYLFRKEDWIRWGRSLSLLPFLISLVFLIGKGLDGRPFGVILEREVKVYSGTGRDNVVLFSLHEGTEFQVQEEWEGNWLQILLEDGKKGWIRKEAAIVGKSS